MPLSEQKLQKQEFNTQPGHKETRLSDPNIQLIIGLDDMVTYHKCSSVWGKRFN